MLQMEGQKCESTYNSRHVGFGGQKEQVVYAVNDVLRLHVLLRFVRAA